MNIEPTYVTFEQAKLLKEKGFNENCYAVIDIEKSKIINPFLSCNSELIKQAFSRPEQWQVCEWLRVNYDLDIIIIPSKTFKGTKYYFYEITKNADEVSKAQDLHSDILEACHQDIPGNYVNYELFESKVFEMGFAFNSPQEAYSAAFDYVLNELI